MQIIQTHPQRSQGAIGNDYVALLWQTVTQNSGNLGEVVIEAGAFFLE
jgi:hypothetical protein